ncbi:MAG: 2,3-bisphosphoglycerate-independent phosphoglycerate mutase [Planctomycetota bacterium]|nr:2,3-bisphosphoglycerate-independent phosphoglycerate mutase [Planctomycetota bacterium]
MSQPETLSVSSPVVLIIRDGWGENPNPEHDAFNAVKLARKPVDDRLRREWPWTLIKTSGEDVGLPGLGPLATMGNSEVGHQNIGAGRVVPQESLVMTKACEHGLHENVATKAAIERCTAGKQLHFMGIASDAGVHGLLEHLFAMLRACKRLGLPGERVCLHLFTDGRDTGPFTGKGFVEQVERACAEIGVGRVVTLVGRYYAMDRDNRWERVKLAYDALCGRWPAMHPMDATLDPSSTPARFASASEAMQAYYDNPTGGNLKGDEFVTPRVIGASDQQVANSRVRPGDSVIFYNYRGDRPREISAAFCFPDDAWKSVKPSPDSGKHGFERGAKLALHYVTMTDYWEKLTPHVSGVAFPKPPRMVNILGECLSARGLTQFRCAETEKYPHVTFFFNDYLDAPFPGERRENPQSPKVSTYDLKPEMAAGEITDAVLRRLAAPDGERVLIVNFANGDMVGHTGNLDAAIKACETVDACVGRIIDATLARSGSLIVTADHGNAEQMFDPATNAPHTAHTIFDVPLHVVGERFRRATLRGDRNAANWSNPAARALRGRLGDVAPTLLHMLGIPQPAEMTGSSLIA